MNHDNKKEGQPVKMEELDYLRKMIQNLVWAIGYNVTALPMAACVLYNQGRVLSPAVGAVLMTVSSVVVAI